MRFHCGIHRLPYCQKETELGTFSEAIIEIQTRDLVSETYSVSTSDCMRLIVSCFLPLMRLVKLGDFLIVSWWISCFSFHLPNNNLISPGIATDKLERNWKMSDNNVGSELLILLVGTLDCQTLKLEEKQSVISWLSFLRYILILDEYYFKLKSLILYLYVPTMSYNTTFLSSIIESVKHNQPQWLEVNALDFGSGYWWF